MTIGKRRNPHLSAAQVQPRRGRVPARSALLTGDERPHPARPGVRPVLATADRAPADRTSVMMDLFHPVAPLVMPLMPIARFQQDRPSLDRRYGPGAIEREDAGPPAHAAVLGEASGLCRRLADHQGVAA